MITHTAIAALLVGASLISSGDALPIAMCVISAAWLALFAWANRDSLKDIEIDLGDF